MPRKIINHFRILLLMGGQYETGFAWSTLNSLENNQFTPFETPVQKGLCKTFSCQVGEYLVFKQSE